MPFATALRLPELCALALALLLFVPQPAQAQETNNEKHLNLEMYWELQSASSPQLSPDGSKIVYTRGWIDPKNDARKSEIWMMDADGERKRFLAEGSNATWSPDGTRIAYLAEGEPNGNQIHVRWMDDEGASSQITRMTKSPSNLRWSPDSGHIAFNRAVKTSVNLTISMPPAPDGAEWTTPPKVVERPVYRRDRQGYVDDTYTHLFVVSSDGGAVRQLTDGDWNHSAGEWTADGEELVFSSLRVEDAELQWRHSEIYAVSAPQRDLRRIGGRWSDPATDGPPRPGRQPAAFT